MKSQNNNAERLNCLKLKPIALIAVGDILNKCYQYFLCKIG